ncbi:hypothetical protein [Novosphingobium sp. AP12]|uniref:hypothetical protein n=1 Tax=Novosphingobium sp. AP12 TaxID=1144305 RepID=UPI00027223D5|nr:hypothetical protein [Novosphingobium sp. AP12]EJL32006.1 hypothetical protein PMI02_01630 [Novosphingobium sp. AP12]
MLGKAIEPSPFYDKDVERGMDDLGSVKINRFGVPDAVAGVNLRTLLFTLSWLNEAEYEDTFRPLADLTRSEPACGGAGTAIRPFLVAGLSDFAKSHNSTAVTATMNARISCATTPGFWFLPRFTFASLLSDSGDRMKPRPVETTQFQQ